MHIGRSHHTIIEIIVSIISGFAASFLTFVVTAYHQSGRSLGGQLVSGDPRDSAQFPSTYNMLKGAVDGSNPLASAMANDLWWMMVVIGGIVAAFIIFKVRQRYMYS